MKLEVGEFYLSASGEILELESFLRDGLFIDTSGQKYDIDGVAVDMLTNYDLIAHIPKQLHFRLCEIIEDYYTDIDVKEFIDDNYKMMKGLR